MLGELPDSAQGMLNPTIRQGRPHDLQTRQSQLSETPEKPQLRGFFSCSVYVSPSPGQGMWSQGNTLCICIEGVPEQNVTAYIRVSQSLQIDSTCCLQAEQVTNPMKAPIVSQRLELFLCPLLPSCSLAPRKLAKNSKRNSNDSGSTSRLRIVFVVTHFAGRDCFSFGESYQSVWIQVRQLWACTKASRTQLI